MQFDYKIENNEVCILRCYGEAGKVKLPGQLEGYPVTALGRYIFSGAYDGDGGRQAVCADMLEEVILPETVRTIGDYAFYGCRQLTRLALYQGIREIGGGAFTGCAKLSRLKISLDGPEGYCFKNVVAELNHEVEVKLSREGQVIARLLFPEYYEEAVENTPARILETRIHGSGYTYRQCFHNGAFKFLEYDSLFYDAKAWESEDFCVHLALYRLEYPWQLTEEHQLQYREYLTGHSAAAGMWLIRSDRMHQLDFLSSRIKWQPDVLEQLICYAREQGRMEAVGYFMDYKYEHYENKKKSFEL